MNKRSRYVCINLSRPLLAMGKCKHCGEAPSIYYVTNPAVKWDDPKFLKSIFDRFKKHVRRFCYTYYLMDDPKDFTGIAHLSYYAPYKSFNPSSHKNRKNVTWEDNLMEWIACGCGATSWAFNEKASVKRPEFFNRKSHHKFPKKIGDWDWD